jgi:hypothetical protein
MLVPVNMLRLASRKFVARFFGRHIRGMPRVKGFVREIPWLNHFAPLDQRLLVVRVVPVDDQVDILVQKWSHRYEIYFVDLDGYIMSHISTNRYRNKRHPYDALLRIDESKRCVRFMVCVQRNHAIGSSITLFKFPKNKPAGPWARELLIGDGPTLEDRPWRAKNKAQFLEGMNEARRYLQD